MKRPDGKTCPVCRVVIRPDQLQRFAVGEKDKEKPPPPLPTVGEPAPRKKREIQYNKIGEARSFQGYYQLLMDSLAPELLAEVQTVESYGSYGTKIQTLVRHILYLQFKEPGTKSIVFSAWADSLHSKST